MYLNFCTGRHNMNQQVVPAIRDVGHAGDFFDPRWYVLFVRSNQEKRVAKGLQERSVEHLLPCYSSLRQWKDRKATLEIPLFPGYIFVRLPLIERLRALTVPQVISFVGRKEAPAVVSSEEIEWIRSGVTQGKAEPHQYLEAGQRVMITEGVLRGIPGILLRKRNSLRVVVSLDCIARAFVVEVEAASVTVIGPPCPTAADLHVKAQSHPA